jgi:cytochrome c oxidase accessory protein FixG
LPATVRRPDLDTLYCIHADGSRNKIHPADVRGRYQARKKVLWTLLIAIYLAVPWLRIGDRPLFLADIEHRHFFLCGHTFNAQDFPLAFFVLTGIGFFLIALSAMFGRIWCGYGCPHTVFLEGVFRRLERWIDGPAPKRRQRRFGWRSVVKHALYLAVALVLAHTFLAYFLPSDVVLGAITGPPAAHPTAFAFVLALTGIVYFDFAWFREQLCIVICPYGRLQGVLYDRDTINVAYDRGRGEPRGRYTESGKGDCIDCWRCVAVCPTGIDIRNGTQLECVGCANCIDACDEVMRKVGRPAGLIRYDSQNGIEGQRRRFVRPRLFAYLGLLLVGVAVFFVLAARRTGFECNLIRQHGVPYELEPDVVRNRLFVHVVNKRDEPVTFRIAAQPLAGAEFIIPAPGLPLPPLADQRVPIVVTVPRAGFTAGRKVRIDVRGKDESRTVELLLLGPR